MIPSISGFLDQEFKVVNRPNLTYRMQHEEGRVRGHTDGVDAIKQAIHKAIMTERYQYIMYSWNYGIELLDLFGEPVTFVCPELKRRITEALICDDRIKSVDGFEFDFPEKGVVHVSFTAHTILGDIQAGREVRF